MTQSTAEEPTTAAAIAVQRVMDEEQWTLADFARAAREDYAKMHRWRHGKSNPSRASVARVLQALRRDPAKYGFNVPGVESADNPPAWFVAHQEQQAEHNRQVIELLSRIARKTGA